MDENFLTTEDAQDEAEFQGLNNKNL